MKLAENFCNNFSSLQSNDKFFFLLFYEQTIFKQVAEQTIYFPLFAEQSFFSQKSLAPQESNGRPLTTYVVGSLLFVTLPFAMKVQSTINANICTLTP